LFTIKGNLVFMNNLYRKIAVASVFTALGFALGANKEAEAATFSNYEYSWLAAHLTFQVIDGGSYGSLDGMGDRVTNVSHGNNYEMGYSHSWLGPKRTDTVEVFLVIVMNKMPKLPASLMQFCGFLLRLWIGMLGIWVSMTNTLLWVSSAT
jgi:hypothetical protein